ncbi:MAG: hypothetical protein HRF42_08230 [Candidatus Brocadia sp.]|jgi:hypothetical protein
MINSAKVSGLLKTGVVLFCFMCLFFATYMASLYEHQKARTEIQTMKVRELEEKVHELSAVNRELMNIRSVLVQEKGEMAKEISALREKCLAFEDWKRAVGEETLRDAAAANRQSTDKDEENERPSEVKD